MKLSPLRKQVESLNKQLESQNIQIKDLINFLSKSTPKQEMTKQRSSQNFSNKLLHIKSRFQDDSINFNTTQKKKYTKEIAICHSMKEIKNFCPIKLKCDQISKHNMSNLSNDAPLTKSVTFHNVKNALTTRKYLKLSRPQKKLNSSCSLCQSSTFRQINHQNHHEKQNRETKIQGKIQEHPIKKQKPSTQTNKVMKSMEKSNSKSKLKEKEKPNSQKKNPLKQLNSNDILSKNQMKSFFEKKYINQTKIKAKPRLQINEEKFANLKIISKR